VDTDGTRYRAGPFAAGRSVARFDGRSDWKARIRFYDVGRAIGRAAEEERRLEWVAERACRSK
jgi:hypothetical protein